MDLIFAILSLAGSIQCLAAAMTYINHKFMDKNIAEAAAIVEEGVEKYCIHSIKNKKLVWDASGSSVTFGLIIFLFLF